MTITSNIQAKRTELKEISKNFLELKNSGNIASVNEGLKTLYSEQGHAELKTFEQWERAGMHVKKRLKSSLFMGSANRQNHHRRWTRKGNKILSVGSPFF